MDFNGWTLIAFVLFISTKRIVSMRERSISMTGEKRLIKHLLENYKQIGLFGRPVYNTSETVHVNFGLALTQLLDLDSVEHTGMFSLWYRHSWNDVMLKWNPSDFEGVNHVRLPASRIWKPDITLYNSIGPEKSNNENAMAVVSSDGTVLWIVPMTVKVKCTSDGNFPSDTMVCWFKYGSWTYDGFKLDPNFYDDMEDVDLSDYIAENDWDLIKTSARKNVLYYPCCEEPYPNLAFTVQFKRTSYISTVFVLPTVISFLLMLLVFWLHPKAVSKFVVGGFVSISFLFIMTSCFMKYRAVMFTAWLGFGLILTFTTMLTSVITSAVAKKGDSGQKLPNCLHTVCVRVFGLILCSDRTVSDWAGQSKESKGDNEMNKEALKQDWVAFAQVLDRMSFGVHVVVLLIMLGLSI